MVLSVMPDLLPRGFESSQCHSLTRFVSSPRNVCVISAHQPMSLPDLIRQSPSTRDYRVTPDNDTYAR